MATASLSLFAFRYHMSCEDQSIWWSHGKDNKSFGCWTDAHRGIRWTIRWGPAHCSHMRHCRRSIAGASFEQGACVFFLALSTVINSEINTCLHGSPSKEHLDIASTGVDTDTIGMFLAECPVLIFFTFWSCLIKADEGEEWVVVTGVSVWSRLDLDKD